MASRISIGKCTPKRPSHAHDDKTGAQDHLTMSSVFVENSLMKEQTQRHPVSPPAEERCDLSAQGRGKSNSSCLLGV